MCLFGENFAQTQPSRLDFQCFFFSGLHPFPVHDPEPRSSRMFSSPGIISNPLDLGEGSSPPETRPLCVLGGVGGGSTSCLLEASPQGFCLLSVGHLSTGSTALVPLSCSVRVHIFKYLET